MLTIISGGFLNPWEEAAVQSYKPLGESTTAHDLREIAFTTVACFQAYQADSLICVHAPWNLELGNRLGLLQ